MKCVFPLHKKIGCLVNKGFSTFRHQLQKFVNCFLWLRTGFLNGSGFLRWDLLSPFCLVWPIITRVVGLSPCFHFCFLFLLLSLCGMALYGLLRKYVAIIIAEMLR